MLFECLSSVTYFEMSFILHKYLSLYKNHDILNNKKKKFLISSFIRNKIQYNNIILNRAIIHFTGVSIIFVLT